MTNRTPLTLLMLLVCVVFSGCSEGGPPPLEVYPVTGTVRLDGEPIGGVSIAFVPDGGAGGGGFAVSDDAGKFSLKSNDQRDGVPAGKYRVLFTKMTMPDGSPIPEGEMAADVGAENSLPEIYNDPGSTSITADVKAGENPPLEFDLQSSQ
ncbi:MAG: carboxypeptidase-like regulatory domain-containing protein [Planctomycetota bacterium]